MILTNNQTPHLILERIARHLSPLCGYSSVPHSSPQRWQFTEDEWTATAVYNLEPPHNLVGLSLDHPGLSDEQVSIVEQSVGLLSGLPVNTERCIFLGERSWDEATSDCWDSGYETLYRLKEDTLRITVRNTFDPARERPHECAAVAEVCPRGRTSWQILTSLHGNLMSSRRARYSDGTKTSFHSDERELLRLTRTILKA